MSNDHTSSTQPTPSQADPRREPVGERLKAMIDERTAIGIRKYGEPLHSYNGRDATRDALEEALDLSQYLAQMVIEAERGKARPETDRKLVTAHRDTLVGIEFALGSWKKANRTPVEALEKIRELVQAHHERARDIIDTELARKEPPDGQ